MELASNGYVVIALDHPHHSFFTTDSAGKTVPVDMGFIQSAIKIENNEYDAETTFDIMSKAMKLRLDDMNFVLDRRFFLQLLRKGCRHGRGWTVKWLNYIIGINIFLIVFSYLQWADV